MCKRSLWKDEEYNVESPGKRIRRDNTFVVSTTTTTDIDNLELEERGKIRVQYIYYTVYLML
jgi:hypothetical protein